LQLMSASPARTEDTKEAAVASVAPVSTEASPELRGAAENVKKFIEAVLDSKTKQASKFCINTTPDFLSKDFLKELSGAASSGYDISAVTGSSGDTVSVTIKFSTAKGDVLTQEYILNYNKKGANYLIANIFDMQYEKINETKKKCFETCFFLENAFISYSKHTASCGFPGRSETLETLLNSEFLTQVPKCPEDGRYSCKTIADNDLNSYEITLACSKHGSLSEITKLYTNLDYSERLFKDFEKASYELAKKYAGKKLLGILERKENEREVFELVRNENINEAFEKFRKIQAEDPMLGELYPAIADALAGINMETEAVSILKEAASYYPEWPIIKEKLDQFKK